MEKVLNPPQMPVTKNNFRLLLASNLLLNAQIESAKIKQLTILEESVAIGKESELFENSSPMIYLITLPIPPPMKTQTAAMLFC